MTEVYINNDGTLLVTNLKATNTSGNEVELVNASITYQIYDDVNIAVPGASGTLNHLGTSNDYITDVDKTIIALLTESEEYVLRVTGSDGGYDFEFDVAIRCSRRTV